MFLHGSVSRCLRTFPLLAPLSLVLVLAAAQIAAAQVQSIPPPTPAQPGSFPSIPAPTPAQAPGTATPAPVQTPGSAPQTAIPPYQDPLQKPIVLNPNGAPPPASIPAPTAVDRASIPYEPAYDLDSQDLPLKVKDPLGSVYIPVDSPVYPMVLRLYSLGYIDTIFLNMRPYTARSLLHALQKTQPDVMSEGNEEAQGLLARLLSILAPEVAPKGFNRGRIYGADSVYTRLQGISGTTLRDSWHIGQSFMNDYGRPYAGGFNNITGFSSTNEWGRFSLYVRGEYQHSPAFAGYTYDLANAFSQEDGVGPLAPPNDPQATLPYGKYTLAQNPFRLQEANLAFHVAGHEISFGKSDAWLGPGYGGGLAWSNNAEDIYSFRINRVEPLYIPYVSKVLGTIRYDFFVGSLKGHTYPNDPWVHSEMIAVAPTANFQFGFQRTVIWGGKGHEPITVHTFLKSFFNFTDTTLDEKLSAADPGARFSDFNFSWRLPFLHHYLTLYTDSITHDDVTPPSAPRRAAYRPGIYLSQFPHFHKLDLRVEAADTDQVTLRSMLGEFTYYESIQKQGYTNKGFIMGDWIGREGKGGQAWLTYHLSADEWVQLEYMHKKNAKDFIAQGTSQSQVKIDFVKHLPHNLQLDAWYQYESYNAPVYLPGKQTVNSVSAQFTYYPKLHIDRTAK